MPRHLPSLVLVMTFTMAITPETHATAPGLGPRGTFDWQRLSTLDTRIWSGVVTIKIVDGMHPLLDGHRILAPNTDVLLDLERFLPEEAITRTEQGFGIDLLLLDRLVSQARADCNCDIADLTAYFSITLDPDQVHLSTILSTLNADPLVEVAYPVPDRFQIPPPVDIPPVTPSWVSDQGYLGPAPDGLDALYANSLPGGRGLNVAVVDMEAGWDLEHEDLENCVDAMIPGIGTLDDPGMDYINHGTAVLGTLVSAHNGYGVNGMVPDATCHVAPDWTAEHYYNIPRAIVMASEYLETFPAVILLEAQTPGPNYDYDIGGQDGLVPVEWEPPTYDAIRLAVARGHVVVEAAGNGSEFLDDTRYYGSLFDRDSRDSGAIIVGAGMPPSSGTPRAPEWYTNYGSRLDVQGWGNAVTTAGYGDLFSGGGDVHQFYTANFAGTSSASPLVTGAVAAILGVSVALDGTTPLPTTIRDALIATGTPQAPSGKLIGPQPDLRVAIGTIVAICGDGIHHTTELCDDGNTTDGDGCSADCQSNEICGNLIVDTPIGEACDDGNDIPGDGCSADCTSDETCGNGYLDTLLGEACDDGDTASGDGCSADCTSDETCGNGVLDEHMAEDCDDGNLVDGDDCSSTCHVEYSTLGGGCGCTITATTSPGVLLLSLLALITILIARTRRHS